MRIFLLFFFSSSWIFLTAQDCTPQSQIVLSRSPFSADAFEKAITMRQRTFTPQEVASADRQAQLCRQAMEVELSNIDNAVKRLTRLKQEVLTVRDVKGMQQQIAELEKSKQEALKTLESNITSEGQLGIFIVHLKGIDIFGNANTWQIQARDALELTAIEDLNGTSIKRLTTISNQKEVRDVIQSMTRGRVDVESVLFDRVFTATNEFLYLAKVKVSPLPGNATGILNTAESRLNSLVLNPLLEPNYLTILENKGLPSSDLEEINNQVNLWQNSISNSNANANANRQRFIEDSEKNIRNFDFQINDLREQLTTRRDKIKQYATELDVVYNTNDLRRTADEILQKIQTNLTTLEGEWRVVKSQEIFVKSTYVSLDGDVKKALSKKAEELTKNLNVQHSTTTKRIESIDIEDFSVANATSSKEVEFSREVKEVWLMPVSANDGFDLYVFARFDVLNQSTTTRHNSEVESGSTTLSVIPENFVKVEGGTYQMGDLFGEGDTDENVHNVTVSTFYLSKYEVTFSEYDAFCTATRREKPADQGWGRSIRPVINVSWCDAVDYANWLSEQHGRTKVYSGSCNNIRVNWVANGYRLPTEAEWEYAARQRGQKIRFGNGNNVASPNQINFDARASFKKPYSFEGIYRSKTIPVGSLPSPNILGLHDMSGNVWEWCWDWYGDYDVDDKANPKGPSTGSYRVNRGGGWDSFPQNCRAAYRNRGGPGFRYFNFGFRLALSSP